MRLLLILGLFSLAVVVDGRREAAAQWCAQYDDWTSNCGFATFNQCLDTVRGVGGVCRFDPRAKPPREVEQPVSSQDGRARGNRKCQSLADANC